jgi:hypothetical protein
MIQFGNFDLWNYADVSNPTRAQSILTWLTDTTDDVMPPKTHGGPWPAEWIDLFRRWTEEGYPRLQLGSAALTATRNGNYVSVNGTGNSPGPGYAVWLDWHHGPEIADIVLYQDIIGSSDPAAPFDVTDFFPMAETVTEVRVLTAGGVATVTIV